MKNYDQDFEAQYEVLKSRQKHIKDPFYYGVSTTGIFCKPGCSSRLPKKENVRFFKTVDEAQDAGYRPCKKCNPLNDTDDINILCVAICRIIETSEEEPRLKDLAKKTGYSETYIQKAFKKLFGISPKEYSSQIKADRLKEGLKNGESVTSSIYSAGYSSSSRVYGHLQNLLAMTPNQYKDSGKGITFRMEIFSCSLGYVLIAFTEKGLCSVQLGDSSEVLKRDFINRFDKAQIKSYDETDRDIIQGIILKVENPSKEINLPLDIHGTVFQKLVWKALQNIPSGETRTYSQIASEIGRPQSVRAVANACGKNEIAVLIPCHRVVGKNGKISGYRWGVKRKSLLLEREKRD